MIKYNQNGTGNILACVVLIFAKKTMLLSQLISSHTREFNIIEIDIPGIPL